jgi:hypothetical protein
MGEAVSVEGVVAVGSFPKQSQPRNKAQTVRRRTTDRVSFLWVSFQKVIGMPQSSYFFS